MDTVELMKGLLEAEESGSKAPAVSTDDAAAIAGHFHVQADRGAAALVEVAKKLEVTIACHEGCNGCCHEMVMVRDPESIAVAKWLARPEQAETLNAFLEEYPAWRSKVGDAPERLAALLKGGDQEAYNAAHREQWRKAVLCAFNKDGRCLIYEVRPMACRHAHAVGTAEHCHPSDTSGVKAQQIAFVPVDELLAMSRRVMRAAERSLRGGAAVGPESLVLRVAHIMAYRPTLPGN
jgi:Fe-S-cluster containining protein